MWSTRLQQRLMRPCGKPNRHQPASKQDQGKGDGCARYAGAPVQVANWSCFDTHSAGHRRRNLPGSLRLLYNHFAGHIRMNRTGV